MSRIWIFAFCVLQVTLLVHATGLYSVVGPGTIRSNFKYNVAVSVHKADGPCKIKVGITGPSYNETKEVEVAPMSTQNVEFDVPKLASGDYNLTAAGTSGITFENSTRLNHADYTPTILLQTDKATYKPADTVKYRVLFLDANTRPANIEQPITVAINDGAQNRIKQLRDVKLTKGVYTGEIQLSEQPVLGTWSIVVNAEGNIAQEKTIDVDGKGHVEFEIPKAMAQHYIPPLKLFAVVEEELTGSKQNASAMVNLHTQRYRLEAVDAPKHYQPDKPFVFKVLVKNLDGTPVQDAKNKVKLTIEPPRNSFYFTEPMPLVAEDGATTVAPKNKGDVELEANLDEHGIATFTATVPEQERNYYSVKASFLDTSSYISSISKLEP